MARELDVRDFTDSRLDSTRTAELESRAAEVSDLLPGSHRVQITEVDRTTGNPAVVASEQAPVGGDDLIRRALDHVTALGPVLGLSDVQAPEFVADAAVQETHAGSKVVHLQQRYKGIPIFQAAQAVRFRGDGTVGDTVGNTITVDRERPTAARIPAVDAVLRAAEHLARNEDEAETDPFGQPLAPPTVDATDYRPTVLAAVPHTPERATVVSAGPFAADVPVGLLWFPADDGVRLSWSARLLMPGGMAQYQVVVDAESGDVLFCQETSQRVVARGNVYTVDGAHDRELVEFPPDWVTADHSVGNAVFARSGAAGPSTAGAVQNGEVVFDPADAKGDDQQVVNIFYYNCWAHDFFYELGFTEAAGNFQTDNRGFGGLSGDAVDARAHPVPVDGTANMLTLDDGVPPIMNMGLVAGVNRHTAFDRDVVLHEFTHGVTNRLVGGPLDTASLTAMQSRGMGEGWGDYFACTVSGKTVVGDWVVDDPGGIRGFPYDEDFPDGFGDLGTGRYARVHDIGEIWCATLLTMNRVTAIGPQLGNQLVIDALKLSPTNPSFLNMRDAILQAAVDSHEAGQLDDGEFAAVRAGIWRTFARFGMGVDASSNGAQLTGIVADSTLPSDIEDEVKV